MLFQKDFLRDLVYEIILDVKSGEYGFEKDSIVETIHKEIYETSRWSVHFEQVFSIKDEDGVRYFRTFFSEGATEMQEESPYEYEPDMIEVKEVFPVEKTIIVYE